MVELSAILVTPGGIGTCLPALEGLRRQTARHRLEVLVVAPSRRQLGADESLFEGFGGHQVVELGGPLPSTGRGVAEGIRRARAPVVVYKEEHSHPEPDWAEILIATHRRLPHAAVGFAVDNANPGPVSWAHLYGQFGPAVAPVRGGEATALAGHHVSYKRDAVLPYGEQLGPLMENECALLMDLRRRGHRLYLAGDALCHHVNISKALDYYRMDFLGQWGFGASRARVGGWSPGRRAFWALAMPLVPLLRLARSVSHVARTGRLDLLPAMLPHLVVGLACGAVGEAVGYLVGERACVGRSRIGPELDRLAFVNSRDAAAAPRGGPSGPTPGPPG